MNKTFSDSTPDDLEACYVLGYRLDAGQAFNIEATISSAYYISNDTGNFIICDTVDREKVVAKLKKFGYSENQEG